MKFKAKRIDNGEYVTGFFTKKKVGSLIVPVIEVYKEWDSGDYMEYYEVDGDTLEQANLSEIITDFIHWSVDYEADWVGSTSKQIADQYVEYKSKR